MNEIDLRWVMIDDWIFSLSLSLEWDDYEDVMSEWIYSNIMNEKLFESLEEEDDIYDRS